MCHNIFRVREEGEKGKKEKEYKGGRKKRKSVDERKTEREREETLYRRNTLH